jgi:hypothetical protein
MAKTAHAERKRGARRNRTRRGRTRGAEGAKGDYVVAIPTYKRYEQVLNKSLNTLLRHKVPASKIHIFVANRAEEKAYREALPAGSYGKIVVGVIGINAQRKFMVRYFKEGTNVLFLDDDVERVERLRQGKYTEVRDLDKFARDAFAECREKGIYLWGIYPVRNPMFMENRPQKSYGLRFILGTFFGQIIRHDADLRPKTAEKEDVENSILHYKKDCGLLRFEKVTIKTKFYNPDGGIAAMTKDRKKVHETAAKYLERTYPEFGAAWKRQSGISEFRLKNLPYKC